MSVFLHRTVLGSSTSASRTLQSEGLEPLFTSAAHLYLIRE